MKNFIENIRIFLDIIWVNIDGSLWEIKEFILKIIGK